MQVIQWPDKRLQQVAAPIELESADLDEVAKKAEGLVATLATEEHGVGLAATQVGWMERVFAMRHIEEDYEMNRTFINPEMVRSYGEVTLGWEGCLSAKAAAQLQVARNESVDLRWQEIEDGEIVDREETFTGINARIIQHEVDHLDGKMYFHRVPSELRKKLLKDAYPPPKRSRPSKEEVLAKRRRRRKRKK